MANIIHDYVKFSVVSWCQFCDHDPHKQVYAWQAEVTEVILLHMPPTMHRGEHHILDTQDGFTHCDLTIIVVFKHGISLGSEHRAQSSHLLCQYQFSQRYAHRFGKSWRMQKSYICFTAQALMPSGVGAE